MRAEGVDALIARGVDRGGVELSEVDGLLERLGAEDDGAADLWATLDERRVTVRGDWGRAAADTTTYANDDLAEATTDTLSVLLREASHHPLLTRDQERELFQRIERGDKGARDTMIASNIRLVVSIARRFQGQGLPLIDLVQEGVLGLMRAIDKFEWRRGYKFSTYATYWVRQAVQRGLASQGREVRLPQHVVEREQLLNRLEARLAVELGRPPTDAELSRRSGIPMGRIEALRGAARAVTSLDRPIGEEGDEGPTFGELMTSPETGPEEVVTIVLTRRAVDRAVAALPQPQREVVRLRYGIGISGGEPKMRSAVARELGLDVERVRWLERDGLARLAVVRELQGLSGVA